MTPEELTAWDKRRKQELANVSLAPGKKYAGKAENQGTCWWPGCDKAAQSLGLCRYHLAKHHSSTLLRVDRWAFPVDEIATLYQDVVAFADSAGITPDEAVTWLIAEGLNSYERRVR